MRSWTAWDSPHEFIWTHYELRVIDRLKGRQSPTVVISEPGGTLDGRSLAIEGAPRLRSGEELIVFLYRTPIGYWRDVGFGQGCYTVVAGRIQANTSGTEFIQTARADSGTSLESLIGLNTADFKSRVIALVARQNRSK